MRSPNLRGLRVLDLSAITKDTGVTDATLVAIASSLTALTMLGVHDTRVTAQGKATLLAALPGLTIQRVY